MKRVLFFLPLMLLLLAGCGSDDPDPNEELDLEIVSIKNPEGLTASYQSPDAACGSPKMLSIYCGPEENELVVRCNNFEIKDILGNQGDRLTPEQLGISVSLVDAHTFKINFARHAYVENDEEFFHEINLRVIGSRPLENNQVAVKEARIFIMRLSDNPGRPSL